MDKKWIVEINEWNEQTDPKFNGMYFIVLVNLEDESDFKVNDEINEIINILKGLD